MLVNVFKNGPSRICGRDPLKCFTWVILEYLNPYDSFRLVNLEATLTRLSTSNTFRSNTRLNLAKNQAKAKRHLLLSENYSLSSSTLSKNNRFSKKCTKTNVSVDKIIWLITMKMRLKSKKWIK